MKISLLSHEYYERIVELKLLDQVNHPDLEKNYFFNICADNISASTHTSLYEGYKNATIIVTPNQGKDIGAKLALVDICIKLNKKTDYYILLHDKKSPHTTLGDIWREKLFRIIEPQNIEKIKKMFDQDKTLGIVCAKEFIMNEYNNATGNFNCTSNVILKELIHRYQLRLDNFEFVGGTMFWVKAEIFNNFFSKHNPLEIRSTLEKGNVLDHEQGTHTHAWERMLSWIAIDQGYKIKGI